MMMAEKYTSTAKVIDGILILSLPDAISPVVWQMELGQSKSSALEIRNLEDGKFILTLKTPRQDVLDIATYANRDLAIKALLATSQALEKAQGRLKSGASGYQPPLYPLPALSQYKSSFGFWCVIKRILKILAIGLSGLAMIVLILFVIGKLLTGISSNDTSPSGNAPMSADEFLESH